MNAIRHGPEFKIYQDGGYSFGLLQKANVVTDLVDSVICPEYNWNFLLQNY